MNKKVDNNDSELRPCPYCGSKPDVIVQYYDEDDPVRTKARGAQACCPYCGAHTLIFNRGDEVTLSQSHPPLQRVAIVAWNSGLIYFRNTDKPYAALYGRAPVPMYNGQRSAWPVWLTETEWSEWAGTEAGGTEE